MFPESKKNRIPPVRPSERLGGLSWPDRRAHKTGPGPAGAPVEGFNGKALAAA